jgi:hypothetical protein
MKAPMYVEYSEYNKDTGWKKIKNYRVIGYREDYPDEAIIDYPDGGSLTVKERETGDWKIKFIWE